LGILSSSLLVEQSIGHPLELGRMTAAFHYQPLNLKKIKNDAGPLQSLTQELAGVSGSERP
jgi:hypothetical protein